MISTPVRNSFVVCLSIWVLGAGTVAADPVVSDGSDGPFTPASGLVTLDLPADGIFNFTTIDIPAGTTVKFNRNAANTPVYLAATGSVTIAGVIDVSATATDVVLPPVAANPKQGGGPGGYNGGDGGDSDGAVGHDGGGSGGGGGGYSGAGAGNATAGLQPTRYGSSPGAAGVVVDYDEPLSGGSGGGGGSAVNWFGWYTGGFGGGGGGALQISTPGTLTITGSILGNGANGGWGYASALANGGAGGGGAGGTIEIYVGELVLAADGLIQVRGGYGGGLSTQPYSNDPAAYSSGGDGGLGYVALGVGTLNLTGTIDGVQVDAPCPVDGLSPTPLVTLAQNHPNPFNPRTLISFVLPDEMSVSLRIYDLAGHLVDVVLDEELTTAGDHEVVWQGRDLGGRAVSAGVYAYRLEAGGTVQSKRMTLVR